MKKYCRHCLRTISPNIQFKDFKKNIEDEKGNVTRFLVMGKNVKQPEYDKNKKFITTCIFRLKSELPHYINVWVDLRLTK